MSFLQIIVLLILMKSIDNHIILSRNCINEVLCKSTTTNNLFLLLYLELYFQCIHYGRITSLKATCSENNSLKGLNSGSLFFSLFFVKFPFVVPSSPLKKDRYPSCIYYTTIVTLIIFVFRRFDSKAFEIETPQFDKYFQICIYICVYIYEELFSQVWEKNSS